MKQKVSVINIDGKFVRLPVEELGYDGAVRAYLRGDLKADAEFDTLEEAMRDEKSLVGSYEEKTVREGVEKK